MAINSENEIFFNFTYYALKLLGKNLYSNPWTAVSELVANGLDAGAKEVFVLIDMKNKRHSHIEIFDTGTGMTYEDLCEKYTVIGRNKRIDIAPEEKENVLGRKGIGKLAALYLSKKYFICTKQNNDETTWSIDASKYRDDEQPSLKRVANRSYLTSDYWNRYASGTLIELVDVDLNRIGKEKIKSLKTILADYYLLNQLRNKIFVAVIDEDNRNIKFEEAYKKVFFSTMYSIFDNSGYNYSKNLRNKVYLTKELQPSSLDIPRETIVLDPDKFDKLKGEMLIADEDGKVYNKTYELKGWIGIHSSLEEPIQQRNDNDFKRYIYRGNSLRLYVRKKLAVDDLLHYIGNTQALANYIEGEISFDILDDDDLEDISTSSREGLKLSDGRVQKLIELVTPIVNQLIRLRSNIGSKINKEITDYKEEERRQSLLREREAFARAQSEILARKKAEEQKRQAEKKLNQAINENKDIKSRLFNLENNFTKSGEEYRLGMHLAVNFAKEIRSSVLDLQELCVNECEKEKVADIDRVAEKIERLPNTIERSSFSLNSAYLREDITDYISQYLEMRNSKKLKLTVENFTEGQILEFDFCDVAMIIENIISNAKKANATTITCKIYRLDENLVIDFINNGDELEEKYVQNPELVFELGESSTGGFGIGCYHIKKIIEMMGGNVSMFNNTQEKGVTFRVVLGDGEI